MLDMQTGHRSVGSRVPVGDRLTKPRAITHSPTLNTIQTVEGTIRKNQVFNTKQELIRSLPKSMQYGTLQTILQYLIDSNKIVIEKDGTIIWTFVDTPEARKSLEESKPL